MILGIDTATRWTGVALYDETAVIAEHGWRSVNTQTIELTPAIADVLARQDLTPADLKGIAVAIGPGSYTGLRVGLGVAKGLALANGTPLIGVPTLDILAASFQPINHPLLVVAEAGRTRVCAAVYRWQSRGGWQVADTPVIETWDALLTQLHGPLTIAGEISPQVAKKIRSSDEGFTLASPAARTRRAGYLAELGWQRLRKGQAEDAAELIPRYLKDPAGS